MQDESTVIGRAIEDDIFPIKKDVVIGGQTFTISELNLTDYFNLINLAVRKSVNFTASKEALILGIAMNPDIKDLLFMMSVGNATPKLRAKDEIQLIREIWEVNKDFLLQDLPKMFEDLGVKFSLPGIGAGPTPPLS
jgi:hypothetical protein